MRIEENENLFSEISIFGKKGKMDKKGRHFRLKLDATDSAEQKISTHTDQTKPE